MSEQLVLFDSVGAHVLWGRQSPRHKWRVIGTADTGPEALALMDTSGISNGDWMVRTDGTDPNTKPSEADSGEGEGEERKAGAAAP